MVGVLFDGSRFEKAVDRVEWDLFRSAVLENQGWQLQRITSPELFRDVSGVLRGLEDIYVKSAGASSTEKREMVGL
jgi:very-short-patch-repair endonuclease